MDLEEKLCLTFQIEYTIFNEKYTYNLKPNGDEISVNYDNREEYVNLYVDWILNKSVDV